MLERSLIEQLLALPANPKNDSDYSEKDRLLIAQLYREIMGSEIRDCKCRNRYVDAFAEIYAVNAEIRNAMKQKLHKSKFRLIPGYVIFFGGQHYSNINLTDEVAAAYLESHPDAVRMFEFYETKKEDSFREGPAQAEEKPEGKVEQKKKAKK